MALLRNVYLHDMGQGIFKGVGECKFNFTMLNSHIARTGGQTGPAHGIYLSNVIQASNPTPVNFTAKRTVFEEEYYGHLVKSHASSNIFDCNVFLKDYSEVYAGAKQFESEGAGFVGATGSLSGDSSFSVRGGCRAVGEVGFGQGRSDDCREAVWA